MLTELGLVQAQSILLQQGSARDNHEEACRNSKKQNKISLVLTAIPLVSRKHRVGHLQASTLKIKGEMSVLPSGSQTLEPI